MKAMCSFITWISQLAIRLFPVAVAFCVLYFPAYKGVMLGYVPVAAGAVIALLVLWKRTAIEKRLSTCSRQSIKVWLFVIPAVLQLVLILVMRSVPLFDGLFVVQHAQNLLNSGNMDPMTYYPPAQTWWYAVWFYFLDSTSIVAQISHIPLSLGVTWGVYKLSRDLMPESAARLAALIVAWYPSFVGYVLTTPYYHYLYTFLMIVMVWGAHRFASGEFRLVNMPWMFLAGIAAGLGALTKGTQLIAPLQIAVWMLLVCAAKKIFPFKRLLAGGAVFLAALMTVLAPWIARNWVVFDEIVPVCTSGGLVLYSANNPDSNGLYSEIPDMTNIQTPQEMLAHADHCTEMAMDFMVGQPRAFLHLAGVKFLHTWGVEATFVELMNYKGSTPARMQDGLTLIYMTGWAALVLFWFLQVLNCIFKKYPITSIELLVGVIILSNALVYVVFEGGDRHHLPMVPLVIISLFSVVKSSPLVVKE